MKAAIALLAAAALLMTGQAHAQQTMANPWVSGGNLVTPQGLPTIGKWMLTRGGIPSHWLGEIYEGKPLREPINVILVDTGARNAEDAKQRLIAASTAAGYPIRMGHSVGYQGYIGNRLYAQLPAGRDDAFSNRIFEESNNHGRIFGPHAIGGSYVFIGAFSREVVKLFRWPEHQYGSFVQAREDFARRLDQSSRFKINGRVPLNNAIAGSARVTTGDHDGMAVVLQAGP